MAFNLGEITRLQFDTSSPRFLIFTPLPPGKILYVLFSYSPSSFSLSVLVSQFSLCKLFCLWICSTYISALKRLVLHFFFLSSIYFSIQILFTHAHTHILTHAFTYIQKRQKRLALTDFSCKNDIQTKFTWDYKHLQSSFDSQALVHLKFILKIFILRSFEEEKNSCF